MFDFLMLLGALTAPQTGEGVCATEGACRHIASVRVEDAEGKETVIPVDSDLPWVVRDNIMLTPGETVTVTLEPKGEVLVPRLVRGGAAAAEADLMEGEIRFSLSDPAMGNLMLTVESKRPEMLDYAALMVTQPGGPKRTSVCTLQPGIKSFENWQAPMRQLALWSFRPTTDAGCKTVEFPAAASAPARAPAGPPAGPPAKLPEGR